MQYLAYCPIELSFEEAQKAAKEYMKEGHVAKVSKGYGSEEYNVRVIPFTKPRANSYGYDLYLYEIPENGEKKYLDCGNFN